MLLDSRLLGLFKYLNAQDVNGMTQIEFAVYGGKSVKVHVRLLDTVE